MSGVEKNVVVFRGWEPGFDKIGFTKLMREESGVGLEAAKALTDRVLAGESVIVWVWNLPKTRAQAKQLGATIVDDPWGRNAN